MANLQKDESSIALKRLRDEMLREAILASREKTGEPDEYFIINYLIDKILSKREKRDIVELMQFK